jgi:hypothetical protein
LTEAYPNERPQSLRRLAISPRLVTGCAADVDSRERLPHGGRLTVERAFQQGQENLGGSVRQWMLA